MKLKHVVAAAWLSCAVASPAWAADSGFTARQVEVDGHEVAYQVFVPRGWSAGREWPVVLFLHGSGERGSDNQLQLKQGLPPWLKMHGDDFPAVVVAPQAPDGTLWDGAQEQSALAALEDSIKAYHGDRSRLYVTGLSMGGYGAWQFAVDHPGLFAAAAVVCGAIRAPDDMPELVVHGPPQEGNPYRWVAERIKPMPVWIFHGDADDQVAPSEARNMYAALLKAGDEVRYTQFAGVGHGSWVPAYATPQLWPWMFSHRLPR